MLTLLAPTLLLIILKIWRHWHLGELVPSWRWKRFILLVPLWIGLRMQHWRVKLHSWWLPRLTRPCHNRYPHRHPIRLLERLSLWKSHIIINWRGRESLGRGKRDFRWLIWILFSLILIFGIWAIKSFLLFFLLFELLEGILRERLWLSPLRMLRGP